MKRENVPMQPPQDYYALKKKQQAERKERRHKNEKPQIVTPTTVTEVGETRTEESSEKNRSVAKVESEVSSSGRWKSKEWSTRLKSRPRMV